MQICKSAEPSGVERVRPEDNRASKNETRTTNHQAPLTNQYTPTTNNRYQKKYLYTFYIKLLKQSTQVNLWAFYYSISE